VPLYPDVSSAHQWVVLPASTADAFRVSAAIPRGPSPSGLIPPTLNLPLTGPERLLAGAEPEKAAPKEISKATGRNADAKHHPRRGFRPANHQPGAGRALRCGNRLELACCHGISS
jgi:hypothetical protein